MTVDGYAMFVYDGVSTHMPLARHDDKFNGTVEQWKVSTHMPLARHDGVRPVMYCHINVSTHMPLARHDMPR